MKLEQKLFDSTSTWRTRSANLGAATPQLVFVFGGRSLLENPDTYSELRGLYPTAHLVIASTSGEICGTEVSEDCIVATAVAFDKTRVQAIAMDVDVGAESYDVGRELAKRADLIETLFAAPQWLDAERLAAGPRVRAGAGRLAARQEHRLHPPETAHADPGRHSTKRGDG